MSKLVDGRMLKIMLRKEFAQLFRDRKMRLVMLAPPIIMLVVFGYAVNTDVRDVRLAVVDHDRSELSRGLVGNFSASPWFAYQASCDNYQQAVALLDRGEVDLVLEIPARFSPALRKGRAGVQAVIDGSDSNRASLIRNYVTQICAEYGTPYTRQQMRVQISRRGPGAVSTAWVNMEPRLLFNQNAVSEDYFLPGVIGMIISLITIMLTSMSIVRERESGTIEQINVSPLRPIDYIAGKILPYAVVAMADIIVTSLLAIFWFGVPFAGSFVFLILCGMLYIVSTLSIGLYISTVSMTQQQAMLSSFMVFIPAILLSGFMFPVYAMPRSVQLLTLVNPLRHFTDIARAVFLKGAGPIELWPQLLALAVTGALLLVLSVTRYSKRTA